MRRALLAAAVLCAAPAAAEVAVSASVRHRTVALDGQLVLSIAVSGDQTSLPQPQLPELEGFSVYNSGSSQSLSWVNGKVSASVVYTYVLQPRALGKFRIPPIAAGSAKSAPIDVEVVKAGTPPPPSGPQPSGPASAPAEEASAPRAGRRADLFVTAALDKKRAYVNEQVTLTVRFLYAIPLAGDSQYSPPSLTGFLTEDLPPVREGTVSIDGRPYKYSEIKTALFPVQPGRLVVGPATVRTQVARLGADPFSPDFFDRFFSQGGMSQPVTVNSDPVALTVEALPPGKPDDFSGVVGRLSAKASADRTAVKAGDAVTLIATVSGVGNLKSVPEPKRPDVPSLRFFETESATTVDKARDRIGGTKIFKTVVVPRVSGDVSVPAFSFSYFDPERRAYARATTQTLALRVAPGSPGAAPAAPGPAPAPGLTAIATDIRYLKTAPARAPLASALASFAELGPWHALPLAALLCAAVLAWRRRAAESDPRGRAWRDARRRAEEKLSAAAALPDAEAARAAALVDEALAGFVADKLGVPAAGLTLKAALEGLRALRRAPSEASLERLRAAWEEADLRRFAPGAATGEDARRLAGEIADLLKALDAEAALR